jgi:hypothetical protein
VLIQQLLGATLLARSDGNVDDGFLQLKATHNIDAILRAAISRSRANGAKQRHLPNERRWRIGRVGGVSRPCTRR